MQLFPGPGHFKTPRIAHRRFGISAVIIVLSLLAVALATIAVGSTIVAQRAADARDRVRKDFTTASRAYDGLVETVASAKPLKKELLQPPLDYYQAFADAHASDPGMRSEVTSARFHMAGLHAKLGSKEGVAQMSLGLTALDEMARDETVDPETVPILQDSAVKVTTPIEWFMVKGANQQYGMQLMISINRAAG